MDLLDHKATMTKALSDKVEIEFTSYRRANQYRRACYGMRAKAVSKAKKLLNLQDEEWGSSPWDGLLWEIGPPVEGKYKLTIQMTSLKALGIVDA